MKMILVSLSLLMSGLAYAADLSPLSTFTLDDGRTIVTDGEKRTVYVFDVDQGTESKCYDGCAQAWPPVLIEAGTTVNAPVGTTTRKDGSIQLTLNGRPIYYFVSDTVPGEILGDGLQGVWHIIEQ